MIAQTFRQRQDIGVSWGLINSAKSMKREHRMSQGQTYKSEFIEVKSSSGWIPLSYVESSGSLFLLATGSDARWCTFILRKGIALLRMNNSTMEGETRLVTDQEHRSKITEEFRTKYGESNFRKWFTKPGRLVQIDLASGRHAEQSGNYFRWLESEFDSVSADYDRHITENSINMLLRDRSLWLMRNTFDKSTRLLEIGCGSGMETIPMLREGHEILAVDISSSMLEVVRDKARKEGLSEALTTMKLRAGEISRLCDDYAAGSFDGCYSTYGALNCEPSLEGVPPAIHALLSERGKFIAGIFNKYCLIEGLAYSLSFRPGRALRRLRNPIEEGNSRFCVDVYSYSVGEFRRIFAPYFSIGSTIGVPVILPPSDLDSYARKFSRRFTALKSVDMWLAVRWPFSNLGDHFLLSMNREPGGPEA